MGLAHPSQDREEEQLGTVICRACMNLRREAWSEGTSMNRGSVSEAFSEALWLLQQSPIYFPILSDFIQTVQGQMKILLCFRRP